MVDKQHILDEIQRTADGDVPLGRQRFGVVTGIKPSDWYGRFWRNWGEALREAGFEPNELATAYDEEHLIEKLIELIRELGHYPLLADLKIRRRTDKSLPSHSTFRRLGRKPEQAHRVLEYCQNHGAEYADVIEICKPIASEYEPATDLTENDSVQADDESEWGSVYLMKAGPHYKIGRSNSVGRRHYELAIQLPDELTLVHEIKTDDPIGIEQYWHKRFDDCRTNGEWFKLSQTDVVAFRRRTFM